MQASEPRQVFESARQEALVAIARLDRKLSRLGLFRLLAFFALIAIVLLLWLEISEILGGVVAILSLVLFHFLIGRYQHVEKQRQRLQRKADLMEAELASLAYKFDSFDGAAEYADILHPFSSDLDLFGNGSVFQLFNRTRSQLGKEALASYFRRPLSRREDIVLRQEAIRELRDALAFRQNLFSASESSFGSKAALEKLAQWLQKPASFQESWLRWAIPLLSLVNMAWLLSFLYLPFFLALLGYVPTLWLLNKRRAEVGLIYEQTEAALQSLEQWSQMLREIEDSQWQSPLLKALQSGLSGDASASKELHELSYDLRQLGVRANPFSIFFQVLWLWDWRYVRRIEARKARVLAKACPVQIPEAADFPLTEEGRSLGLQLEFWLKSVASFEAMSCFAAAWYRWPDWVLPEIQPAGAGIEGEAMHHPLIIRDRSVGNGFASDSHGAITLLTGSNMAGKSTLLRTIGLQLAMARWGSAVPAGRLSCPVLDVYTSMRTQDNLLEGASAFYAELRRLRQVVDALESGQPVFFLLDELLKGTNTQDRQVGGRALIRQLLQLGGAGIIATHDLELAEMAEADPRISALRLEVLSDAEGELFFDYLVKPGVARSRNASALMKRLGLGLEGEDA